MSGERIYFFSGFAVEFAGYLWTVAVSGKKKLRIRKCPDKCGRGLNINTLTSLRGFQDKPTFGVVFFLSKSLSGIEGQKKLEKIAILTRRASEPC